MPEHSVITWIVVARRSGATLYVHRQETGLVRIERVPGVRGESPGPGADLGDPRARDGHLAELRYTLKIAEVLEARVGRAQGSIILMAESRMLGAVRRHLSAETARHIQASLNVAQPDWDEATLAHQLAPFFGRERSPGPGAEML